MRQHSTRVLLTSIVLLSLPLLAQECSQLQGSTSDEMVSYLEGAVYHRADPVCIVFAMKALGERRYDPAIPVLTQLLKFRQASVGTEQYFPSNRPEYPAIPALVRMGEPALPSLLDTIKSDTPSAIAKHNALFVWMVIHEHQQARGVEKLKAAADRAIDARSRDNLLLAVSSAVKLCIPREKAACEAAARRGLNPDGR